MLPAGQGAQRAETRPTTTLTPPGKEEALGSRFSEVQGFITECHALANGSLSAIGNPIPSDLELRSKLETLKNALD